jgi:multidrug efflux pump subunit AcrA (membrane-fusion protein)
MIWIPVLILAATLVHGIVKRKSTVAALRRAAAEQSILPVEIIRPTPGSPTRSLRLPGTVRAWFEAPIFAQVAGVAGYVRSWNEDYGATVKAGQLLASIDAPGLDAEYAAAQANLAVAQANYQLAVTTAQRWKALSGTKAVSQQEVDSRA